MSSDNKMVFYGGVAVAALAALFGGLYIKNKVMFKPLSKAEVIDITKDLRRNINPVLQQITKFHDQFKTQLKPDQFKEVIETEQGLNFKVQLRDITDRVAQQHGTDGVTYQKCLTYYALDPDVKRCTSILEKDYLMALSGFINDQIFGELPLVSKDRLLELYKKVTQAQFINTAESIKLMAGKSEQEVMSDPDLVAKMSRFESEEKEKILVGNGLTSKDDSVVHVYSILVRNMEKSDPDFRSKIKNIEAKYQQVFQKHYMAFQQTQKIEVLNNLEDELIFMDQ